MWLGESKGALLFWAILSKLLLSLRLVMVYHHRHALSLASNFNVIFMALPTCSPPVLVFHPVFRSSYVSSNHSFIKFDAVPSCFAGEHTDAVLCWEGRPLAAHGSCCGLRRYNVPMSLRHVCGLRREPNLCDAAGDGSGAADMIVTRGAITGFSNCSVFSLCSCVCCSCCSQR